jgi:hypothetical protein
MKLKIIIVGGGIAGLAAATILSDISGLEIIIYEKEPQIGGQAASIQTEICNIEYSWRVYGGNYNNLRYIFTEKLNILKNLKNIEGNCFIKNNEFSDATLNFNTMISNLFESTPFKNYYKYTDFLLMDGDRIIRDYDINAYEYFDKNPIVQTILGPLLGMDANKVSLAGSMKNLYSMRKSRPSSLTINPTNISVFNHWENYLINKGVSIYKNSSVENITIENNKITNITINHNVVNADEFIFALSLKSINKLFENKYKSNTLNNMKLLENNLQLYFTINIYFSKEIKDVMCPQSVIVDMPWLPIIQRKLSWSKDVMDKCYINNQKIKEVWNVGFLDYNKGKYNNKILRDCSLEEAIQEGLMQTKENNYIKSLFAKMGLTFDDIYIGCEHWYQFKNDSNGKIISTNPKFSVNVNTMKYIPNAHNKDMPINLNLCGYYVNNTFGGASMEASCETGLIAGKNIIDKYSLKYNDILPIKHDNIKVLTLYTYPLVFLDSILFYFNLPPVIKFINSFYLLILYFALVIVIIIYIIYKLFTNISYKYINNRSRKSGRKQKKHNK